MAKLNWATDSAIYDLHWKSIPMGAITDYCDDWYDSYLGRGVYMLVVCTTDSRYVGFYVGKSKDIGRRWSEHLQHWFIEPDAKTWIPVNADDFLEDPVAVFNKQQLNRGWKTGQKHRLAFSAIHGSALPRSTTCGLGKHWKTSSMFFRRD